MNGARKHIHVLQHCHDCGGDGCGYCEMRGYLRPEFCAICKEPMGVHRKKWKRRQALAEIRDEK